MPEYLYKVDRCNRVLGRINRDRAHSLGILHRSGIVFLANSRGQLALCTRSRRKSIYPRTLDCACSYHVEYGEKDLDAAKREFIEETGIVTTLKFLGKFLLDDPVDRMYVSAFVAFSDEKPRLDPAESENLRLYSFKEANKLILHSRCTPWLAAGWKKFSKRLRALCISRR